jgi:hypothetical protein
MRTTLRLSLFTSEVFHEMMGALEPILAAAPIVYGDEITKKKTIT